MAILTEKDTLRETWLADGLCPICGLDHPRGIGGTMMAMVLGLVEWQGVRYNALDAYHRLTRDAWDPGIDSIHTFRGNHLESDIREWYEEDTGRETVPFEDGFATHPDFPAFVIHPDAMALDKGEEPEEKRRRVVECKAPSRQVFERVYERGLRKSEIVQLATYQAVLRVEKGSFAFGNLEHEAGPILPFDVDLDPELGPFLLEIGQRFMDEHVSPRIPPDPEEWKLLIDPEMEVLDRPGVLEPVQSEDWPEVTEMARNLLEAKDLRKKAEESYEAQKTQLQAVLERDFESDKILIPGVARLTIVRSEGRSSFSKRALEGHKPIDRDALFRMIREEGVDRLRDARTEEDLDSIMDELALDLDQFNRQGNPFSYLLPNPHND